jgi:plastocyanin
VLAGVVLAAGTGAGFGGCPVSHAAELRGQVRLHVRLQERLQARSGPSADVGDAVVWWVAASGGPAAGPAPRAGTPQRVDIGTQRRQFSPRTRIVAPGSTVRFPNADPIRHNVFSVSGGNRFDLGLYGQGPGRSHTFEQPGLVRVFCNVHRQMAAWVLVLETPFHAGVAADGSFELLGLPPGRGVLHVWHPRAAEWTRELTLPAGPEDVELDAAYSAVPEHLDKFGRPYPETPDDGTYR